jgi:PAS domain S-box-containing protein
MATTPAAPTRATPPNGEAYRLLFENSEDGMMLTALDGSVLDANPAACRIFGRTRDEILAAGRTGLIDVSDPRLQSLIEDRLRTGRARGELTARHKDGRTFPIEISSVLFQNEQGQTRTCMIIRDITVRKTADAERECLIKELREALGRVKTLSGLLPMCAACRRIRDSLGCWHNLEIYIRNHTEADFSHGICPECRRTLYPESIGD